MLDTSPPAISICIPTLAGYYHLYKLLSSIKKHTPYEYETIIIDSGNKARGYAIPANRAITAAQGEAVIILNDDIEVTAGWIDPLLEEMEKGTWVAFPDQRESEGAACLCGWALCFSRFAIESIKETSISAQGEIYDEQFILWCSDIDLAKRLHNFGFPPVCVQIPEPLKHVSNATTEREPWTGPQGQMDIETYKAKWGSDPNEDKYALQPIYR